MIIVLFGAPGAGKGTVAERLSEHYGIPHVSTGDLLRAEFAKKTAVGKKIRDFIDAGLLVPDDVIVEIVRKRIGRRDCSNGFLLDGFPRTVEQARELGVIAGERGEVVKVFDMEVPEEVIVKRLCARRICPKCGAIYNLEFKPPKKDNTCDVCGAALVHRSDDRDEIIRVRLREYEKRTKPVLDYYEKKKVVFRVSGLDSSEVVEKIIEKLGPPAGRV